MNHSKKIIVNLEENQTISAEDLQDIDHFISNNLNLEIANKLYEKPNLSLNQLKEKIQKYAQNQSEQDIQQQQNCQNNLPALQKYSLQIETNKSHLVFLIDVSQSMLQYVMDSKSLHVQAVEIILKSILDSLFNVFEQKQHKKKSLSLLNYDEDKIPEDLLSEDEQGVFDNTQKTFITIYLFGQQSKEVELIIDHILVCKENLKQIYANVQNAIKENIYQKKQKLKDLQSPKLSPKMSPTSSFKGSEKKSLKGESYADTSFLNKNKGNLSLLQAMEKVIKNVKQEGQSFCLTNLCVITDGVSYDDMEENEFYQNILSQIKLTGFSCNIICSGSENGKNAAFSYVVFDDNLRKLAKRLNGKFHRAKVEEVSTAKSSQIKLKAIFDCCNVKSSNQNTFHQKWEEEEFSKQFSTDYIDMMDDYQMEEIEPLKMEQKNSSSQNNQNIESNGINNNNNTTQYFLKKIESQDKQFTPKQGTFNKKFQSCGGIITNSEENAQKNKTQKQFFFLNEIRNMLLSWEYFRGKVYLNNSPRIQEAYQFSDISGLIKSSTNQQDIIIDPDDYSQNTPHNGSNNPSNNNNNNYVQISSQSQTWSDYQINIFVNSSLSYYSIIKQNYEKPSKYETKKDLENLKNLIDTIKEMDLNLVFSIDKLFYYSTNPENLPQGVIFDIKCYDESSKALQQLNNNPQTWERYFIVKDINIVWTPNPIKKSNFQQDSDINYFKEFLLRLANKADKNLSPTLFLRARNPFSIIEQIHGKQDTSSITDEQKIQETDDLYVSQFILLKVIKISKYCTQLKIGFRNYMKDYRKDFIKQIKQVLKNEDLRQVDLNIMEKGLMPLFKVEYFDTYLQENQTFLRMNKEVKNLKKKWTWSNQIVANIDKFFKILLYLRKNYKFKVIKNQKPYSSSEQYIFFREMTFIKQNKPQKKNIRLMLSHIITKNITSVRAQNSNTFKQKVEIDVEVYSELCLDIYFVNQQKEILQNWLQRHIQLIYKDELKIIKKLYTLNSVYKNTLLQKLNKQNMDEFTEKTVSKLSPEFIQELMKNKQDPYKQETQRQIIIKQNQEINYENQNLIQKVRKEEIFYRYISHILKQDYSTFDPKYEQYLDYSFLLENSYPLDPKTLDTIKFENLNTDDSLKKAKQVCSKLLEQYQEIVKSQGDYTIFLKNKEQKQEKTSIYISKLISSNIILIGQLFEQNIEEMVTDHSKEIKVQYYLIHMQFSENNTNPSRDSIEEYLKMTEDYLKSFQKSYNQVFSNLIYQACSLGLSVETESLQKGILSCRSTQKVHHISMNELYNIFQWYNRDLSKKYKKANFIKSSLNTQDQSFAFQADRTNKQKESFFLKNNKEENSNCSLLLQSNIEQRNQNKQENQQNQENSHSQPQPQPNMQSQYPQEILELPDFMGKFQDDILEPANQSFEWVINYFFQKIEGTEYYYKKIQDQNYITKAQQNNFFIQEFVQFLETQKQLGSEDLLFLKIYCLTSKQMDSQNVQPNHSSQNVDQPSVSIKPFETYEKAIFGNDEKNISRKTGTDDKIKIQIVFEYYLRPEDQQEQQQQQSANQEPVSQATGLYQKELRSRIIGNMKNLLDCLNAQTLLEYYRVKYPLLKADLHKITNSMTVLNKNHNLSQKQFSINILKHPNSAEYIKKEIKSNHLRELLYLNTSENTHYLVFKQQRPDRNKSVTLFPEQMLKKNNQSQQVYDLDDEDDITILKKFLEAGSVLYVVPFWILLNQKDEKTFYIDCYIPFKRTSQQLNYQMIHDKLSYFLQQLQQRTNQYILFQQMCETHICPPDLKINQKDEIEPSKKETAPKTSKIKQNRYEKNLLFANNKKEQTNTNTQKQWKYKIPMIHQRYFPVYEKFKDNDGLKCIHSNQDFFNNAIRGLDGAYLIPNLKSEYFVIAIEEINNNMMQKSTINTNSSQMSFQGDVSYSQNQTPGSSQKESFLNNNLGQTKGSIFVNSVPYNQNQDSQPKLVSEEFQQSRRLIDMRIYSLNENLDQSDKDYFDNKIKEAQIPETIKQMSSIFLRSSYPKLSHAEYAFIANSDKQTTLKYKIPNFIIDYDSFFIFLKQHLLKVFYKLSIHSNSQNQHSQNSHSHIHHAQTQIFIEDSNQSSQQQPDLTQQSLLSNQNYKPQILNQQKNLQFQYNHQNCELNCNNNNLNQSNKIISSEFYDEIEGLTIPYERGEFSFLFNHLKKQNGHTSILRDTFGMCLFIMVMQISFENKNQQYQLEESDLQQQQEFQILDHFHKFFPKQDIQNTEKTDIQNISLGLVSDGYFYDKTHELDHLVHQNQINLFNKPKIINSPISNAFKNFNNNSYNQNAKKTQNQNYTHPQYMMSNQIQNQNQSQSQNQHHLNLSPILGQQQDKADKFLDLTSPVRADKKNDTQNMSNLYDTNSNNFESAKQQINDIPYNNTQNKEMESIKSLESSHNSLVNFDNNYTYQQQVLEFSIIHKGQFIQEKLTTYLTELLNQVTADYLIETIIYKQLMSQNKTAKSILKTINSFDKILLNQKQKSFSLTSLSFKHNLRFKNWFIYFQEIYYRILDIINKKKDGKLQTNPQNQISQDQKQESLTSFDFKEHKFKKCLKNVPHLLAFIENEKQQQQSELQIFSDLEKLEKVYKQYEDKHVVLQKDNNPKIQLVINNNLHEHIFCEQSENLDEEQKAQLNHQYQETYKCIQHFKSDLRVKKEDVNNNKFGKNFYTPRNFFLKLELDKKSFKLLCYNTNSDLIQHMANEIQNIQKIMEQRNLLLQQIIIQKLGIYNYDLSIKPKVSEQKSEFDYIDIINDTTKKLMHETHRKPITQQIYKSKFQIGNLQGNPNVHQSQNFAYTNMAQNQPEKEKLTLTKKVTIYIENILPNLEILAISNEFVEIFDKFKNVTLNKIKPTFTKTDFDEQNESNQIEDQLQIHGMPYLSFAKIFYINNLKKAFFKKMLVLSASESRTIKEKYVKQFLKGPGQILKQEIIPLFLFPIQEFKTPNIVHMDSSDRNFSNNQIPEPIGQNIGKIEQQENFYSKSLKKLFKSSQNKYSVHVQSELQYEYFMDEQLKGQKRQITNNMNNHNVSSNSLAKSKNIMAFSLSEQLYKLENTQNNQNSNNNGTQFSNINNLSKNSLQSQGSQEELVLVKNSRRAALDFVDKFYTEKAKALLQSTTPILRRMENTIFKKAFQHSVLFLLSLQLDYPLIMQTLFVSSLWNSDSIEAIKNQEMISLFEQEHNYFAYIYYNFHIQLIQLKLKQYEEIEEIQLSLSNKPYYTNDQNEEEMRKRKRQQQIKEEIKNDIKIDIPMIWNHVQNFYSIYNFKTTIFTSHKLVVNIGQMFTSDESDKIMPFLSEHYQQFGFEKQIQLPQSLRIMLINQDYIEELGTTRSKLYVVFKIIDKYEFELFRNIQGSAIKVHKDEESDDNPLFLIYHIFVNESDDKFYQPEIHDPVIQKIHLQTQKIIEETFIRLKKYYTAHAGIEELQQSDNISIFSIKFIRENCIVGSLGNLDQEFQNNLKTVKLFGKDFIDMLKTKYQNEIKRKDFDNKTLLFIIRGDQKLGIMVELCNEQLNDMVFFHAFSNSDDPDLQSLQEELILCVLQWMTIKNYESL